MNASSSTDLINQLVARAISSVAQPASAGLASVLVSNPGMAALSDTGRALADAGFPPVFYEPKHGYGNLSVSDARQGLANLTASEPRVLIVDNLDQFSAEEHQRFRDTALANRGRWAVIAILRSEGIDPEATRATVALFDEVVTVGQPTQTARISSALLGRLAGLRSADSEKGPAPSTPSQPKP